MMRGIQLVLIENALNSVVQVFDYSTISPDVLTGLNYRTSPIFSVSPEVAKLPCLRGRVYLGFFTVQSPFTRLAILKAEFPELSERLFFSIGLPSVIVFVIDDQDIARTKNLLSDQLRAYEVWPLDDGVLDKESVQHYYSTPELVDAASFKIAIKSDSLDFDTRNLLAEVQHNVNDLLGCVRKLDFLQTALAC